jgi:multidrug resistance efflux pump
MLGSDPRKLERGRHWALAAGAVLLLAILTPFFALRIRPDWPGWFSPFRATAGVAADQSSKADPGAAVVRRGSIKKTLLLDGDLRAVRSRTIYSNTDEEAKIVYLPPEGTTVKAGDRLIELDSGTLINKIKEAEERIVAADNEIVRIRSQHESALRELEVERSKLWLAQEQARLKARVPSEVLSRREYQESQLALEKAKTEYDNHLNKIEQKKKEQAAEFQVKTIERDKLKVQLDRTRSNLDGMRIGAPTAGMVLHNQHWQDRRKIQIGDVVWGGYPLVLLPDLSEMEVLAQVNEVDGPKLSIGGRCELKLDSYPDTVIAGAVKEISQTAIKASWMAKAKIFRVTISLDKTVPDIMKPGMSGLVSVTLHETPRQLLIPRAAVRFEGADARVFRIESDTVRRDIAVTILGADALQYLVADNGALKEGDRISSRH